ncbi:MAG: FhaA domain-containing protein [Actinomycetota bacterium]
MGILKDFERRLEHAVEGFFARALPGGGLQPIELAKRMVRMMQDQKTVGVSGQVVVPNSFTFYVSDRDAKRLEELGASLSKDLTSVARRAAKAAEWTMLGPPMITVTPDASVHDGMLEAEAHVRQATDPTSSAGAHTQLIQIAVPSDAELVVLGSKRRAYPLSKDSLVIGRNESCDVVLNDPGASRRNTEVRREGDEWYAIDLGSTNGTLLNGRGISRARLSPKDILLIGNTQIEFRV